MGSNAIGFCAVAGVLGLISALAGVAGELTLGKRLMQRLMQRSSFIYVMGKWCLYPTSPAFIFGAISAVFAIITQIYICGGRCCRKSTKSTTISKLFSVFSWVGTGVALILLLIAAISKGFMCSDDLKPGILASAGILSFLSAVFGMVSYVTLSQASRTTPIANVVEPVVAFPAVGGDVDRKLNPTPFPNTQHYSPRQHAPQ